MAYSNILERLVIFYACLIFSHINLKSQVPSVLCTASADFIDMLQWLAIVFFYCYGGWGSCLFVFVFPTCSSRITWWPPHHVPSSFYST